MKIYVLLLFFNNLLQTVIKNAMQCPKNFIYINMCHVTILWNWIYHIPISQMKTWGEKRKVKQLAQDTQLERGADIIQYRAAGLWNHASSVSSFLIPENDHPQMTADDMILLVIDKNINTDKKIFT